MNAPDQTAPVSRRPDIEGDTQRVIDVLRSGGIAICPNHVGYGIWAGSKHVQEFALQEADD